MESPRKPTTGFWITVALVTMLLAYPLSFGPACWISARLETSEMFVDYWFQPILRTMVHGPLWFKRLGLWYSAFGVGPRNGSVLFLDLSGHCHWTYAVP